jgi:hypothetical protein
VTKKLQFSRASTAVNRSPPRADFGLFLKSQGSEEVERAEIKLQRLNAFDANAEEAELGVLADGTVAGSGGKPPRC